MNTIRCKGQIVTKEEIRLKNKLMKGRKMMAPFGYGYGGYNENNVQPAKSDSDYNIPTPPPAPGSRHLL